jgi:internalin A
VTDLGPLESTWIATLHLGGRLMADASPIGRIGALVELALTGLPSLGDLMFLNSLRRLRRLGISACNAPLPTLELPVLERFWVEDCPGVRDLNSLAGLSALRELLLNRLPVIDLTPLAQLPQLEMLWLTYCRDIHDLSPLSHLPLRLLDLTGADPGLDTTKLPPGCRIVR